MGGGLRRDRLTEADRAEWAQYARLVRPLPGRQAPPPEISVSAPLVTPGARPAGTPAASRPVAVVAVGVHPGGVDRATWQRFRGGKLAPVRTLDLHGRTAQRAFHALVDFLHTARAEGVRCVEVITGRGAGEAGGVLRRELPLWLNLPELRGLILAATHPHPANPGSVRILLRRLR